MATGQALVCRLKNLEPIEDADNLVKAEMCGETVIIGKDYDKGDLGILFDCESQLGHKLCHYNNLYRHSELNYNSQEEGYFDDNRRVRPIRLRGVKCSGFWIPISYLENIPQIDLSKDSLSVGQQFNKLQGVEITKKYKKKSSNQGNNKNKSDSDSKKTVADRVQNFKKHFSTSHFFRNEDKIRLNQKAIITEKLHGTSARVGFVEVEQELSTMAKAWNMVAPKKIQPEKKYQTVVGSRNVIKSVDGEPRKGVNHYYSDDLWTEAADKHFKHKLEKGETVYFEIVGYQPSKSPIMGNHRHKKLKPFMDDDEYTDFIEQYGESTDWNYGCRKDPLTFNDDLKDFHYRAVKLVDEKGRHRSKKHGHYSRLVMEDYFLEIDSYNKSLTKYTKAGEKIKHYGLDFGGFNSHASKLEYAELIYDIEKNQRYDIYVYRITQTLANGDKIDYNWEQVKQRCRELNVNYVPELAVVNISTETHKERLADKVKELTESESREFPDHIREGVCVRLEDGSFKPKILKNKAFLFRVMEGQIKEEDDYEDIEENN